MRWVKPGDQVVFRDYNGRHRQGVVEEASGDQIRLSIVNGDQQHKVILPEMVIQVRRPKPVQQGLWAGK